MLEVIAQMKKQGALDKKKTPIKLAGDLFKLHNRSEAKSPRTVEWYETAVAMLIPPKGPFPPETEMGQICELELRVFIADLSNRITRAGNRISPATFNNYVRSIKTPRSHTHRSRKRGHRAVRGASDTASASSSGG